MFFFYLKKKNQFLHRTISSFRFLHLSLHSATIRELCHYECRATVAWMPWICQSKPNRCDIVQPGQLEVKNRIRNWKMKILNKFSNVKALTTSDICNLPSGNVINGNSLKLFINGFSCQSILFLINRPQIRELKGLYDVGFSFNAFNASVQRLVVHF